MSTNEIGHDAADRLLSGGLGEGRPETNDYGLRVYDGGVAFDHQRCNRWTKYGHDRLYFVDTEGYIDLDSGAVEGDTPVVTVEVHDDTVVYYAEDIDDEYPIATREVAR